MATNKGYEEIAFGAKDSELYECEYTIPEGYEAEIKDGKVIIRKKESEDEGIRKRLISYFKSQMEAYPKKDPEVLCTYNKWIAWIEKQVEQKHQYISRPRYVGEEELLGTNKQEKCPFLKQELIDMGFAFTQDGDLAYPIHKIENKESAAWKPSDEQMEALNYVVNLMASSESPKENDYYYNVFKGLREQLKKL